MPTCQRCQESKEDSEFPKRKKENCKRCSQRLREIKYANSPKGKAIRKAYTFSKKRKQYEAEYSKTEKRISYMEKYKEKMRIKYREDEEFRKSENERRLRHFKENPEIKKKAIQRHTKNNPEKQKARTRLRMAVYRGTIQKPKNCEICNKQCERIEGHHHDYSKPFEVVWLCQECHKIEHGKIVNDYNSGACN